MAVVSNNVVTVNKVSTPHTYKALLFGPKVGQIGPKFDKSGTFPDQISGHFGSASKKLSPQKI